MTRTGLAVFAAAAPLAAGAPPVALHVKPAVAARGSVVVFSGSVGTGCVPGDSVTLISRVFPGHAFGEGAIMARVHADRRFRRSFRVPATTPRRAYLITARCGGGNLGVATRLRVR